MGMVSPKRFANQDAKYFFSEEVPENVLRAWQSQTPKVIAALEFFAAVAAVEKLSESHPSVRIFLWTTKLPETVLMPCFPLDRRAGKLFQVP